MFSTISFSYWWNENSLYEEFGYLGVALLLNQCWGAASTHTDQWFRDLSIVTNETDSGLRRPASGLNSVIPMHGTQGLSFSAVSSSVHGMILIPILGLYEPQGWYLRQCWERYLHLDSVSTGTLSPSLTLFLNCIQDALASSCLTVSSH